MQSVSYAAHVPLANVRATPSGIEKHLDELCERSTTSKSNICFVIQLPLIFLKQHVFNIGKSKFTNSSSFCSLNSV